MSQVTHSSSSPLDTEISRLRAGIIAASGAFLIWGFLPVYWKGLQGLGAVEIIAHRIVWAAVCAGLVLTVQQRWGEVKAALAPGGGRRLLLVSSGLIGVNWLVYVHAVNSGHVVEASLGYYINPLVNVLLGFVFLRDRLSRLQAAAIGLAAIGVMNLVVDYGRFPWIALTLAFSFGLFGLVRKVVRVEPLPGLFLETVLLGIPAAGYLLYLHRTGAGSLGGPDVTVNTLLVCAGVVTALPLLLFAFGARRMRLPTLGILQYLAPTCMFLLGVFIYGELFTRAHAITFCLIWAGVGLYVWDGLGQYRRERRLAPPLQ